MDYVGKLGNLFTSVQAFYNDLNPATLSGAIDIVVVEQEDGDLACTPFHVRFGKLSLLMPQEKKVEIKVNGEPIPYMMKVGEAGEAFFVFETEHDVPEAYQTSPIMGASQEESKADEEPPYLDIGESKTPAKGQEQNTESENPDQFDEEDPNTKLRIPAELQSPKMIIEEQIDRVVTKVDHSHQSNQHLENEPELSPKNDVYPMNDGATLLERLIPEAITSTTIAKETFIVRPANGDIFSTWMDVVHTSVERKEEEVKQVNPDNPHRPGESESIVLDISGYKTTHDDEEKTGKKAASRDGHASANERQHEKLKNLTPEQSREILKKNEPDESMSAAPFESDQDTASNPLSHVEDSQQLDPELEVQGKRAATPEMTEVQDKSESSLQPETTASVSTSVSTNTESTSDLGDAAQDAKQFENESQPEITVTGSNENDSLVDHSSVDQSETEDPTHEQGYSDEKGDDEAALVPPLLTSFSAADQSESHKYIRLEPGVTYRIELSLCGLSALGADDDANDAAFTKDRITYDNFVHNPNLLNDPRLVFRHDGRYYVSSRTGPLFSSLTKFKRPTGDNIGKPETNVSDSRDTYSFGRGWRQWLSRSSVAGPPLNPATGVNNETTTFTTTTKTTSVGWSADHTHPDKEETPESKKHYAKTLRLTSDQLKTLKLKKGVNTITFSVTSAYQGTATCAAKIFFWDYDVQIVISDIDGTITKSDTLGHVFTMIGKDWTHSGVAKLYTDVYNNGYKLLYLTSRAIGQADYTRDYLRKIEQNKYQLPDGPVIMSPDRLFTSLHREVIMRKPEVFKMACLRDVMRLFDGRVPFYAGFGNRITDAISYRSVNVPQSRIFTIDPNGELKLDLLAGFRSSYIDLNDLVDQIFPPINKKVHEEYSDWNFWKAPLPDIELPELEATPPPTSPKPKPIQPDPSALPASSVAAAPERKQRGILRSFTSRSSANPPVVVPGFKIAASTSTPTLLGRKTSNDSMTSTLTPGSPTDTSALSDDQLAPPSPTTPDSSSSSGIMNKVFSGVFSRRAFSKSTTSVEPPIYHTPTYEDVDDDALDATLDAIADEIDMDNIPFI